MYLLDQPDATLAFRRQYRGLIGIGSKVPLRDRAMLSLVYTPGVAEACRAISRDEVASFELTGRGNTVAILTDGTDLFGPTRGPVEAALPLLEAKSVIFKTFAGVDAVPICVDLHDPLAIVEVALRLTPTFGAICLDHIRAPHSFTIADHLEKGAPIPVFSNQHHGTAILVLGALKNALDVVGKQLEQVRVVIAGAGLSGIGVARLLYRVGVRDIVVCDRAGAIYAGRTVRMNWAKAYLAKETNPERRRGSLADVLKGADVFIGLAQGNIVTPEMVASMAPDPVIFALALPTPEIDPELAKQAGAAIVATGRADYPNMMDISLVFPGVFRGLLDSGARNIRLRTLVYAAEALASLVPPGQRSPTSIVPQLFDFRVAPAIAAAVVQAANETREATRSVDPATVAENTRRYVYEGTFEPRRPLSMRPRSLAEEAIELRQRHHGVLEIRSKIPIRDPHILNLVYLPPAALVPVDEVRLNPPEVYNLTVKGNLVAIVTDGSAVLGLGDIGPQAALPVMEGKAVLFQSLAGVEAFPICVAERDPQQIVDLVEAIAPSFGGINLEDISAPRCFEIEAALKERLDLPVFHDDQHGTAVVVLAGLINAFRLRGTPLNEAKIVINGAGAAGIATAKLLLVYGVGDLILCDRHGIIARDREIGMNRYKLEMARLTNKQGLRGTLADALVGADVFIGLSSPDILTPQMISTMAPKPIIFALANPDPEIHPDVALEAGALVVATGRSDYPNQVNNSLAFPGIFRGALDVQARDINDAMKLAAAEAIASLVTDRELASGRIIPDSLDLRVPPAVAAAVARAALDTGVARVAADPDEIAARTRTMLYETVR
ncbi:malic enzyme-like NAD(P)-binding protein [Thermorudis peleae]|uniref:malic enzyme-like NAD(P)-binding protein n=1 Tax=Thermorudis peleae TaxID=1382356 RepID=UPI0009DD7703